jgi:hypothetical protein
MRSFKSTPILFYLAILGSTAHLTAKAQYSYQWLGGPNAPYYYQINYPSGIDTIYYDYVGGTPIDGFTTPTLSFDSANSNVGAGIYAFDLSGVMFRSYFAENPGTFNLTLSFANAAQPWNLALSSSSPFNNWSGSVVNNQLDLSYTSEVIPVLYPPYYQPDGIIYLSGPANINADITYSGSGSWTEFACGGNTSPTGIGHWNSAEVSYTMAGTLTTVPEPKSEGWLAGSSSLIAIIAATRFKKNKSVFEK